MRKHVFLRLAALRQVGLEESTDSRPGSLAESSTSSLQTQSLLSALRYKLNHNITFAPKRLCSTAKAHAILPISEESLQHELFTSVCVEAEAILQATHCCLEQSPLGISSLLAIITCRRANNTALSTHRLSSGKNTPPLPNSYITCKNGLPLGSKYIPFQPKFAPKLSPIIESLLRELRIRLPRHRPSSVRSIKILPVPSNPTGKGRRHSLVHGCHTIKETQGRLERAGGGCLVGG